MRKKAAIAMVTSLVLMVFVGFQPASAENPGGGAIGEYHQFGVNQDLTPNHVEWTDGVLEVKGPPFTNKLKVETAFLQEEVGAWASLDAFTPGEGVAEFDSREASLVALDVGPDPVFTWGAVEQIEFVDRPMWVSMQQDSYGEPINLTLTDGDPSGQQIYISKEWLWERGIHRPNATHEDGTNLNVIRSQEGDGFLVEVHHFSTVVISPANFSVLGQLGDGEIRQHMGDILWYPEHPRLEIDVGGHTISSYSLFVEKDWLEFHVPWLALRDHTWTNLTYQGIEYLVVDLPPESMPAAIRFETFSIDQQPAFTRGHPDSVAISAVNDEFFNLTPPLRINLTDPLGPDFNVDVSHHGQYRIQVSDQWLSQWGIEEPVFRVDGKPHEVIEVHDGSAWLLMLQGNRSIQVFEGDRVFEYQLEWFAKDVWVYVDEEMEAEVIKPLFAPWYSEGEAIRFLFFCDACFGTEGEGPEVFLIPPEDADALLCCNSGGSTGSPKVYDVYFEPPPDIDPEEYLWSAWELHIDEEMTLINDIATEVEETLVTLLEGLHVMGEGEGGGGGGGGDPIPGLPWPLLEEILQYLNTMMVPEHTLEESSVTVYHPEGVDASVVVNPMLFEFLIPNPEGVLSFTVNYKLGYGEPSGSTVRLKVTDESGIISDLEKPIPSKLDVVKFREVPAQLDASYYIGIDGADDFILPFEELLPNPPTGGEEPCYGGLSDFNRETDWLEGGALGVDDIESNVYHDITGLGWSYKWTYWTPTCPEIPSRTVTGSFGFNIRSLNVLALDGRLGPEFGAYIEGNWDYEHNNDVPTPYTKGHLVEIHNPRIFYNTPVTEAGNVVEHLGPVVDGRAPHDQNCGSLDFAARLAMAGIGHWIPPLGFLLAFAPSSVCELVQDDDWNTIDTYNGAVGEGVRIPGMTSVGQQEVTGGLLDVRYVQATEPIPIELRGGIRYDVAFNPCFYCDWTGESGGHYGWGKPWIEVVDGSN